MNLFEGLPAFVLDVHSAQYARIVHKYLNRPEQGESRPEYIVPRRRVSHVKSRSVNSPRIRDAEDINFIQDIAGNYKCTSRHEPLHDRPPLSSAAPVTIATLPSSSADFLVPLAIEGTANQR